jgi:AcrR family transcriptional regulator
VPKIFDEADKAAIKDRLVTEGKKLFQRYGLRKTSVEELARAAGIAKGTFYHFFESKEDLCFAVFDREEELMAADVQALVTRYDDPARTFRALIDFSIDFIRSDSLMTRLRESGEMELLARGVSPEKLTAHLDHDVGTAQLLIKSLRAKGTRVTIKADVLAGVLRAFVALTLQEKVIGEPIFKQVMNLFADWIAAGLLKRKGKP